MENERDRVMLCNDGEVLVRPQDAEQLAIKLRSQQPEEWRDFVVISGPNESGWIGVFHASGVGWLVSSCGRSDANEYFLYDPSSNDRTPVQIKVPGSVDDYPRRLFVHEEQAMRAIITYIKELERDRAVSWLPVGEIFK